MSLLIILKSNLSLIIASSTKLHFPKSDTTFLYRQGVPNSGDEITILSIYKDLYKSKTPKKKVVFRLKQKNLDFHLQNFY